MPEIKVSVLETPRTCARFPEEKFIHSFKCGEREFFSGDLLPWRELLAHDPERIAEIDATFAIIQKWRAEREKEIEVEAKACDVSIDKLEKSMKPNLADYRSRFRKNENDSEMYFKLRDGEARSMVIDARRKMLFAETQRPNLLKVFILRIIQGGLKMLLPLQIVVNDEGEAVYVWHSPVDSSGKPHEKPMETDILRDFPAVISALFGKEEAQRLIDKRLKVFEGGKSEADVRKEIQDRQRANRAAHEAIFGKGNEGTKPIK